MQLMTVFFDLEKLEPLVIGPTVHASRDFFGFSWFIKSQGTELYCITVCINVQ